MIFYIEEQYYLVRKCLVQIFSSEVYQPVFIRIVVSKIIDRQSIDNVRLVEVRKIERENFLREVTVKIELKQKDNEKEIVKVLLDNCQVHKWWTQFLSILFFIFIFISFYFPIFLFLEQLVLGSEVIGHTVTSVTI